MSVPDPADVVPAGGPLPRLLTQGNQLVVEVDGQRRPVRLRGINRSGFQHHPTLASAGLPDPDGEFRLWRSDWNVQAIRYALALHESAGLKGDLAEVENVVKTTAALGQYLILELHGVFGQWSQISMPPLERARPAWEELARAFGGFAHVIFDPWNEPRLIGQQGGIEAEWSHWQPLAQALVDAIRGAGATETLILIGGADWAYDLSPLRHTACRIDGRGGPLAYAAHVYPFKGPWFDRWTLASPLLAQVLSFFWRGRWHKEWNRAFGTVARELPVIVTEFGAQPEPLDPYLKRLDAWRAERWNELFLSYVDERDLSALAWSAGDLPHLVQGTLGGPVWLPDNPPDPSRATNPFGEVVRKWLRSGSA